MARSLKSVAVAAPQSQWRQLSEVVGALILRIDPLPPTTGKSKSQGSTAQSR